MASKTELTNWAMIRVGEDIFTDVDTDGTATADKVNAIYDIVLVDLLTSGPEFGWQFANRRGSVDIESFTVTAFALSSATETKVTAPHTLQAGESVVITNTTNYNGEYVVVSVSTTVSFVITKVFTSDDATGTVKWISDEYMSRFAIPTSLEITSVSVGGVELTDWITENEFILTSQEGATIVAKYIQSITDTTKFPPHFVSAFRLKLASDLAYDLTQNGELGDRFLNEFETLVLPRAIGKDARERFVEEQNQNWVLAGHSGGTRTDFNLPRFGGTVNGNIRIR